MLLLGWTKPLHNIKVTFEVIPNLTTNFHKKSQPIMIKWINNKHSANDEILINGFCFSVVEYILLHIMTKAYLIV